MQGVIQPDMWGVSVSGRWDWPALRQEIEQHGVRNSLLCAPMPTASTSQILGNNECEPRPLACTGFRAAPTKDVCVELTAY